MIPHPKTIAKLLETLGEPPRCGVYLGDNDGTCPQLTCIRAKGHDGAHDNVRGDDETLEPGSEVLR